MANRILQLKRNGSIFTDRASAISTIGNLTFANGEIALATYTDTNAINGKADIVVVTTQDKLFYIDNQEIINKIGANYGQALDFSGRDISAATTIKAALEAVDAKIIENEGELEDLIESLSADTVSGESKVVIDVTQEEGKITATAANISGVKLDGYTVENGAEVAATDTLGQALGKLQGQINAMDKNADAVDGQVVTTVEETNGVVSETKANVKDLQLGGYVKDTSATGEIGSTDTINAALSKLENTNSGLDDLIDELSGKTVTAVDDTKSIDMTIESNDADGTKKVKADLIVSASGSQNTNDANIITVLDDGVYASVDYNALENALYVNGVQKPLNAGSIVDSISYDSSTEELVITYHTTSSSTPLTVKVNVKDLIEEYDFPATDTNHNVGFSVARVVGGKSTVQADVNLFDCGEY